MSATPAAGAPAPLPFGRRLQSPVVGSLASKGAEMATLLLLATVVPRVLGPAAYGRLSLALTIVTVASVATPFGGAATMARFVSCAPAPERAALARALGGRLARRRAVQLAGVVLVVAALVAAAPARFPPLPTALVTAALVAGVAATLTLQIALGLRRTAPWSVRYPLHNSILIVAALVLGPGLGAAGAAAAVAIASLGPLALALATVARPLRGARSGAEVPAGALRFGALQGTSGVLLQVVHRGGVVAVAVLVGSSVEAGFAGLAIGVALAATYAVLQAFTVALPGRVEQAVGDPAGAEAALRRSGWIALAVAAPVAGGAALVVEPALAAALGESFRGAADAFAPALALVALAPVSACLAHAAALRLRPEASAWASLAGAIAFLAVALAAVPAWGAAGATSAMLAGVAATALVGLRLLPGAAGRQLAAGSLGTSLAVLALAAT